MDYQSERDIESHRIGFLAALGPRLFLRDLTNGLALLWRVRGLATSIAVRELRVRYAGQFAGAFWIIGHPIFQMVVYVFVFGVVFRQQMGGTYELPRDYTTYILSGLVPWLTFSSALPALCTSVVNNASLVKQFTFQAETLALKDVLISMVFWAVGIAVATVYTLTVNGAVPWTYLLLPLVLALNLLFVIGVGWALSAVGVFVRDIKDVAVLIMTAGIYIIPVVYLPSWAPPVFRPFIELNPLSSFIWTYQDTLYYGRFEHPYAWIVFAIISVCSFTFGFRLFQVVKPFFGKVL